MPIDLNTLESAAKAATPGPWMSDGLSNVRCTNNDHICVVLVSPTFTGRTPTPEDAAYIAAANPAVVLELIATIHKNERAMQRLARALRIKIRALAIAQRECKYAQERAAKMEEKQ